MRFPFRLFARGRKNHSIDPEDIFLDSSNISNLNYHQFEGHFEKPLSSRIAVSILILVLALFATFSYTLYGMQIEEGDVYAHKAANNALRRAPLFPHRGTIEDRNGVLLAWNGVAEGDNIPRRHYTELPGFSHILGYVSYPKKDSSGIFWQDEYVGKDGVEKVYQHILQGEKGERIVEVSATNNIISENITTPPQDGENLVLTIDASLQEALHGAIVDLARKAGFVAGAGAIMDVRSGELLAVTSYPEYDNNLISNASSTEDHARVKEELRSKDNKFLNRAIAGVFTPGSIVKPFIALAALNEGIIDPYENIYSSGALVVKNPYGGPDTVFKDWKAHGYVDMREALAVSSDQYFYEVGGGVPGRKGLGIDLIYTYMKGFGFEQSTGIDLPGEIKGTVPSREWKQKTFKDGNWILGNTYHTSIGQFGFQTTVLEVIRAVSLIANGGTFVTPHVYTGAQVTTSTYPFKEEHLRTIREGMRQAVTDGTARALSIGGVVAAAKTGTAEVGARKESVNSWVAGYVPYESPKYAFVVVMERAPRGNTFGAPLAFSQVLTFMRDKTEYLK